MILMFLGAWPLSSQTVLMNNVSEKKLLPKNHPFVKALKKHIADGRGSELVRKLEDHKRSLGSVSDETVNTSLAIDDFNMGNYRSFYLEHALKDVAEEIGDYVLDPFTREYVKKSKKRRSYRK